MTIDILDSRLTIYTDTGTIGHGDLLTHHIGYLQWDDLTDLLKKELLVKISIDWAFSQLVIIQMFEQKSIVFQNFSNSKWPKP